jgi:hypothetical protein
MPSRFGLPKGDARRAGGPGSRSREGRTQPLARALDASGRAVDRVTPDLLDWAPRPGEFTCGEIIRHLAGAERVIEFLDEEPSVQERKGAISLARARGHVEFDSVRFSYPGNEREALSDVSFEVGPGEVGGVLHVVAHT